MNRENPRKGEVNPPPPSGNLHPLTTSRVSASDSMTASTDPDLPATEVSSTADAGSRIQKLSVSVVNKIAAGEVIERPASVVKELVENSIDALATRIEVDIGQGGAELIRILDNGEGIHPDDLLLAVTPHATSKIREADDLFHVRSMGFRGEALASIAEVSQFRIRSRRAEHPIGHELQVDAGILKEPIPSGGPVGTTIEVKQLFVSTPVRRKFLKSPSTEFAHIAEQFTRLALANPNLHMVLRHNDRTIYELPATDQLRERLELFYGSELAKHLIPIEGERDGNRLWGFVAHPSQTKPTRKGQYLFLNGRWIQDRTLQQALTESYRGLVMVGRYPIAFLFLEMSPENVDVNVHPTKSEVRFLDSQPLFRLVLATIRTKFLSMNLDSNLDARGMQSGGGVKTGSGFVLSSLGGPSETSRAEGDGEWEQRPTMQQELASWIDRQLSPAPPAPSLFDRPASSDGDAERTAFPARAVEGHERDSGDTAPRSSSWSADAAPAPFRPYPDFGAPRPAVSAPDDRFADSGPPAERFSPTEVEPRPSSIVYAPTAHDVSAPTSAGAEVRAMQVHDCYLIVETTEGIQLIDQHALHERIMYERLRERVLAKSVEVQRLLIPVTIELSPREVGLLIDQTDVLAELGLQVQSFSGNTVALTGYPTMLAKADPAEILRHVVDELEASGQKVTRRDLLDSILHMMSCKAAIKAGQRLKPEEIESLLAQRHLVDDAHHCPHGRPTALMLSRVELDRQFGRLGS
ncbi:DNA mismatch repair protein MutL [Planctomyces sp. SH-PL14]|nr:DNA mismatch repair protein MutL [Planctomyces sp. SH-PL14]